jgi:hypothetical protein
VKLFVGNLNVAVPEIGHERRTPAFQRSDQMRERGWKAG